jgi:hypothetical protein
MLDIFFIIIVACMFGWAAAAITFLLLEEALGEF